MAGTVLEYQGVSVVPVFAPGYIEKNTHLFTRWAEDFHTAYQAGCGINKLEKSNQRRMVLDIVDLMDLIEHIKKSGYVSFDFETSSLTDLKTYDPDFTCTMLSLSFQQGSSYIIPLFHKDSPSTPEFIETCRKALEKDVFLNSDITKIGQNVKFDMHCLDWWGIPLVRGPIHDTMVMHHLLDEHSKHGLKLMVARYNPRYTNYEQDLGPVKNWLDIDLDILSKYGALDSDLTFRLYWQFIEMLLEDERLYILFRNLIAPATPALFAMEQRGMLIDKEYLLSSIETVKGMIKAIEQEMREVPVVAAYSDQRADNFMVEYIEELERKVKVAEEKEYKTEKAQKNNLAKIDEMKSVVKLFDQGLIHYKDYLTQDKIEVNLASPQQIIDLLYGPFGFRFAVPSDIYGRPLRDSSKDTLDLLTDKTGFINNLLALRQLKKIQSTYLEGILNRLDDKHRIHGSFNQAGTKTGRLSSSDPNLQNIIKRTKYKKVEAAVAMVMKCFISPKGMQFMQADYSQAELRIIAHYAQDENMLKAYNNGEDLHAITAAMTMNMPLEQFKKLPDKEQKQYRYEAKSTNFGFIYIMSAEGFKEYARINYGIEISLKQAKIRREKFFRTYPRLTEYHRIYIAKAKKYGYVRTLFGQKLRLPDIYSTEKVKQGHAERNAVNGPIQGTAGQMMIFAIALLYHRASGLLTANTVHDSLDFYCHPQYNYSIVKETMENLPIEEYFGKSIDTVDMSVDFEASPDSWGDLKEIV